ncbi:class I SAM-dependent methyltransferase [soil metagenome]
MTKLDAATVGALHAGEPGITEALLRRAHDSDSGQTPYTWLAAAVPLTGRVVDLGCGSAPIAELLAKEVTYIGIDRSAAELAVARDRSLLLVQADARDLPLTGGVDAVISSMALMLVDPIQPVLRAVAAVLRPGGTLIATLPALTSHDADDAALHTAVLAVLGRAGIGYPTTLADAAGELAAAGLHLVADDTINFAVPVANDVDAHLLARSYYAVDRSPAALDRAAATITDHAAGRCAVGYAIRRIVARRA